MRVFAVLDAYEAFDTPPDLHVAVNELLGVIHQLIQRATQVTAVKIADNVGALEADTGHLGLSNEALRILGKKHDTSMGRHPHLSLRRQAAQVAQRFLPGQPQPLAARRLALPEIGRHQRL